MKNLTREESFVGELCIELAKQQPRERKKQANKRVLLGDLFMSVSIGMYREL